MSRPPADLIILNPTILPIPPLAIIAGVILEGHRWPFRSRHLPLVRDKATHEVLIKLHFTTYKILSIGFRQTIGTLTWRFGAGGKEVYGWILRHGHHHRMWTCGEGLGCGWLDVGDGGLGLGGHMRT